LKDFVTDLLFGYVGRTKRVAWDRWIAEICEPRGRVLETTQSSTRESTVRHTARS